jgi:hypothetical protein
MRILPDALCTPHEKLAERVGFEPTLGFPKHAFQACAFSRSATSPFFQFQISDCRFTGRVSLVHAGSFPGFHPQSAFRNSQLCMAERPGFEPGVELPPQQFSRLPPSATRPPLQILQCRAQCSSVTVKASSRFLRSELCTPNYFALSFSKNFWSTSRQSASSTPGVMRYVWFSLPSRTTSYTEPSTPALGSLQP